MDFSRRRRSLSSGRTHWVTELLKSFIRIHNRPPLPGAVGLRAILDNDVIVHRNRRCHIPARPRQHKVLDYTTLLQKIVNTSAGGRRQNKIVLFMIVCQSSGSTRLDEEDMARQPVTVSSWRSTPLVPPPTLQAPLATIAATNLPDNPPDSPDTVQRFVPPASRGIRYDKV